MPKVSQDYRDARRAQILDAARRCFVRNGFQATSMQDLFAEAGLSSGSVYRYFASKDQVILAIAEQHMREVMVLVRERTARPGGTVGGALADVLRLLAAKHEQAQLGAIAVLVWAEVVRNQALSDQFKQLLGELRSELAGLVTARAESAAAAAGAAVPVESAQSAESVASVLTAIIAGYIMQVGVLGADAMAGVAEVAADVIDDGLTP